MPSKVRTVRAYDASGRAVEIPIGVWASQYLPAQLRARWTDPAGLALVIETSLQAGLGAEILGAARRLVELNPGDERAVVMVAIALMNDGDARQAQAVLETFLSSHTSSTAAKVNLAKALELQGLIGEADLTLMEALQENPNLENGLRWFVARLHERGADAQIESALSMLAERPGAWRPQLYQAAMRLHAGDPTGALGLYRRVLDWAPADAAAWLSVTGELVKAGLVADMVRLGFDHYQPDRSDLRPGANIFHGLLAEGRLGDAASLLSRMRREALPPGLRDIAQWEEELRLARTPQN